MDGWSNGECRSVPDIDECQLYPSICKEPARCVNTPGMYECRCPKGFQYNFTSKTCSGEMTSSAAIVLIFYQKQADPRHFLSFQTWMSAR